MSRTPRDTGSSASSSRALQQNSGSELALRLASAVVGIPLVLLLDRQGGWTFCVGLAVVSVLASLELVSMLRAVSFRPLTAIVLLACVALALLPAATSQPQMGWLGAIFVTSFLAGAILLHPKRFSSGTRDLVATISVPIYVGLFLASLGLLRDAHYGAWWVFFALLTTWAYDTGGYTAGRLFGRRSIMPHVSPKKTFEGVIGGLLTAAVACAFAAPVIGITLWQAALLGLIAGVLAQTGDLVESMIKRNGNLKDSGSIIPGHGGLLDRIDSLLLVAPLFLFVAFGLGYAP